MLADIRLHIGTVLKFALVAFCLAASLAYFQLIEESSKYHLFRNVEIGMTEDQINLLLIDHRVPCETMGMPTSNAPPACDFSDAFRYYHIGFDPATLRVAVLRFGYLRHAGLLSTRRQ